MVCACLSKFKGLNCALIGGTKLVAILSAGIIAAIAVAALAAVVLAGGGGAAATSAFGATNITSVAQNPLYTPATADGTNPLFGL